MTEATDRYEAVRGRLIEVARNKECTTYGELAEIAGLPAVAVGRLLDEIVTDEAGAERPMLSAVVVDSKGRIGDGFFNLAAKLGRTASPERSEAFLTAERERVYEYWSRPTDQRVRVRDRLIEVVRNESLVTYGELEPIAEIPAVSIGPLVLDAISRDEASEGRPMLSAVVVNADTRNPGDGFYRLAFEVGRAASPNPDVAFWAAELKALYEYWSRNAS